MEGWVLGRRFRPWRKFWAWGEVWVRGWTSGSWDGGLDYCEVWTPIKDWILGSRSRPGMKVWDPDVGLSPARRLPVSKPGCPIGTMGVSLGWRSSQGSRGLMATQLAWTLPVLTWSYEARGLGSAPGGASWAPGRHGLEQHAPPARS